MALDNVTVFEIHLGQTTDDEPTDRSHAAPAAQSDEQRDDEESSGGFPVKGLLLGVLVLAGVGLAARRFLGGDEAEIETEPIEPGVEVEHSGP